MQDRYAGDIGDFLKLGMLRALCSGHLESPALRLGIVWYLVPDESHNQDGRHISYLDTKNETGRSLRECDEVLHGQLAGVVHAGNRSVAALEAQGVLPEGSKTACGVLSFANLPATSARGRDARIETRVAWLEAALRATEGCDLVFLDPDNGLAAATDRPHLRRAPKYAFAEELAPFVAREQSVIVYQHADRSGPVATQAERKLRLLEKVLGVTPLGAVRSLRGPCRLFLVVPAERHRELLRRRLEYMTQDTPWSNHLSLMTRA